VRNMQGYRRVGLLFGGAVLAAIVTACGATPAGQATNGAQAPASIRATDGPPATAGAEPTSTGSTPQASGGPVRDQASLIDALRATGATVTIGDAIEQPFVQMAGTQVSVNGADVQVFEYADEAAARADAAAIADTLAGKGTTMVSWVASPHAYQAGRVIVLYVGDDTNTLQLLQGALGAPFAELSLPAR
jgi:hypothetical protein